MAVIKAKPTSPGRRGVIAVKSDLYKGKPLKSLTRVESKNGGRNNNGRITVRHQGGGHKQHYRVIDFKRNKFDIPAVVERIEYDPNRSAHIALLLYKDGERRYIIAPSKLKVGDKLSIMSSVGIETIIGSLPKQETFIIRSIFDSGLADFDANVAFINLKKLEDFFDLDMEKRNLEIFLIDPSNINEAKIEIQKIFNNEFVFTWADMNSSLFSALKVERNVMFIILSLIIIVAAFNIISGLTILVKNKTKDIAILKSIGVLNKSITKIFFLIGIIIGTSATFFGIFLGVMFSLYVENFREFLSNTFNISLFPEEIYFLNNLPSEINFNSILIIAFGSILVTIIVSIYPALKASKMNTVKALKYE